MLIWLEESQELFQVSYGMMCMYVGIVHTVAAAELVVWGYEVYPAQQTTRTPHREPSCPCIMPTSEERAAKKAKTVDRESGKY